MRIIRIGLDTSKHVFQIRGVDVNEQTVLRRQIQRSEVETFGPSREFGKGTPPSGGDRGRILGRGPLGTYHWPDTAGNPSISM
jgi:hypothetical protein